jgi:hypothetical protein
MTEYSQSEFDPRRCSGEVPVAVHRWRGENEAPMPLSRLVVPLIREESAAKEGWENEGGRPLAEPRNNV